MKQPKHSLTITAVLFGAVCGAEFFAVPHIAIAPAGRNWPREFIAVGVCLMPVLWSGYLLSHCATRADRIIGAISAALALFCVAITIPHLVRARLTKGKHPCENQLALIQLSKTFWAQEQHKTTNDTPTWDDLCPYYIPYFREGVGLGPCLDGGTYTIGRIGELPTCSNAEHTEDFRRAYQRWHQR